MKIFKYIFSKKYRTDLKYKKEFKKEILIVNYYLKINAQ